MHTSFDLSICHCINSSFRHLEFSTIVSYFCTADAYPVIFPQYLQNQIAKIWETAGELSDMKDAVDKLPDSILDRST